MILCNPHNPIGRVWTQPELARLDEICRKHDVRVISDEIHGDIVYPPHHYVPFASLSDAAAQNAFICLTPAKTFNLAGMIDGMVIIANENYRQQYDHFADRYQINRNNVFSTMAIETAYREGGPWLDELLIYLRGNIDFMRGYLAEHNIRVKLIEPDGTYLVWLDFNELGLEASDLARFLAREARLALNSGFWLRRRGRFYAHEHRQPASCHRRSDDPLKKSAGGSSLSVTSLCHITPGWLRPLRFTDPTGSQSASSTGK